MKEFDYYLFIDYSENLIGYNIIGKGRVQELLEKTTKLQHFKKVRHDKEYIAAIKKRVDKEKITELLFKHKIIECRFNIKLFAEIIEFLKKNQDKSIFISIDDTFYISFIKLLNLIDKGENLQIIKEGNLKRNSTEYRLSLIIDNLLIIERRKSK